MTPQRWLKRKLYQFELSLSVYMMTPGEKFAFCTPASPPPSPGKFMWENSWLTMGTPTADSIFFLLCSLTFIAVVLYLPHHISFLVGRAWYYINGEHIDVGEVVKEMSASVLHEAATTTADAAETMVKEL